MRGAAAVLAVALLLAAVLAGCGGAMSKEDYSEQFREAVNRASPSALPKPKTARPDPGGSARSIERLGKSYVRLRDELKDLDPPEEVAGPHREFVQGVDELSRGFSQYVRVLRGDREAVRRGAPGFYALSTTRKLERATRAFEKAGYGLGLRRGVSPP